jgi:hypothetical protein
MLILVRNGFGPERHVGLGVWSIDTALLHFTSPSMSLEFSRFGHSAI